MTVRYNGFEITWLGYACVRIEAPNGTVVYTDPGRYGTLDGTWKKRYGGTSHPSGSAYDAQDGDLVLITHDHHYQSSGIRRVADNNATILVYEDINIERIKGDRQDGNTDRNVTAPEDLDYNIHRVAYEDSISTMGVNVDIIPAYNHKNGPRLTDEGKPIHSRGFGCGYRFVVDGTPIFWPGDSDVVDEHEHLDVSLLFPSIARSNTMNRHDALGLARQLQPDLVVPIHYNTFEKLGADSQAFAVDIANESIPVALDEGWLDYP